MFTWNLNGSCLELKYFPTVWMIELMKYAVDPESIQAYRTRVFVFSQELWREKDPAIRATKAMYLAEAAATLAQLEVEEAQKAAAVKESA